MHVRDASVEPATDDWPFLYLRDRHMPAHYLAALALVLVVSIVVVLFGAARAARGMVVAVLPARRRLHAARDEVDHPVRAAVGLDLGGRLAGYCVGAVDGAGGQLRGRASRDPPAVARRVGAARACSRSTTSFRSAAIGFESRAVESLFYAVLVFSPILCAGLLFGSAIKRSTALSRDYGTNLLGAMVGGVGEYLSLVTGFRALLLLIAPVMWGRLWRGGKLRAVTG